MICPRLALFGLLAIFLRHTTAAELDSVNLDLSNEYDVQLRWDNIEGPPLWDGGVPVVYSKRNDWHSAEIPPGSSSRIRLPPMSMLRIALCDRDASIEIWSSTDGRLYQKLSPAFDALNNQFLIAPQSLHELSIEVRSPVTATETQKAAFFVSRYTDVANPVPYRRKLYVCDDTLLLCTSKNTKRESVFEVSPGLPREFVVDGPCRIECESRFHYPYGESAARQAYRIRVDCDGSLLKHLECLTNVERQHSVSVDRKTVCVGRAVKAFFDCPPGRHTIRLSTPYTVYAQLHQQECPQYLLPINDRLLPNSPRCPALLDSIESYWSVTESQIAEYSSERPASSCAMADLEQVLLKVANDNDYRRGGTSAWWTMHQAAVRRPVNRSARTVAEKFKRHFTTYRSVLPVSAVETEFGWLRPLGSLTPKCNVEPADSSVISIATQHLQDSVGTVAFGGFSRVGSTASRHEQIYVLPADRTDSQIRISVVDDARFCGRINVRFDDGPPLAFELKPHHHAQVNSPTIFDAALSGLWHQHGKYGHATLGGPFGARRVPAPSFTVASAEVYLPQHVSTVRVSTVDTGMEMPRVALHVRSSRYRSLTEFEFLVNRKQLSDDPIAIVSMLNNDCDSTSIAWREIWNHFRPIIRLLRSHDATFSNGIQPMAQGEEISTGQEKLLARARQLQADRQWLAAVEAWSKVLATNNVESRIEALPARATALANAGEHFLAERQMRSAVLHSPDENVRRAAFNWLQSYYENNDDTAAMERLAASVFLRSPDSTAVKRLIESFVSNGRYKYALSVALLASDVTPDIHIASMRAAARVGWWQTYDQLLRSVRDPQEREFWCGIRCLSHGSYDAALQHFLSSGDKGVAYSEHLTDAFSIAAGLRSSTVEDREAAISRWQQWSANHPGPHLWQEEPPIVRLSSGNHAVYSENLDSYSQYFRGTHDVPVQLRVLGPLRLKLELRPVLPSDSAPNEATDGWFAINVNGRRHQLPILSNYPSSTLTIIGSDQQIGQRLEHVVEVPIGEHWIEVFGAKHDVLTRCFVERPEHPISVLPPLTIACRDAILSGTFGAIDQTPRGLVRLIPNGSNERPAILPIVKAAEDHSKQLDPQSKPVAPPIPNQKVIRTRLSDANIPDNRTSRRRPPSPPIIEPGKVSWTETRSISANYPHPWQSEQSLDSSRSHSMSQNVAAHRPRRAIHVDSKVVGASHTDRIRRLPIDPATDESIRLQSFVEPAPRDAAFDEARFAGVFVVPFDSDSRPSKTRAESADLEPASQISTARPSANRPSKSQVVAELRILLRRVEIVDDPLPLQIRGGELRDLYPRDKHVDALFDRLAAQTAWRSFSQFTRSAGIRVLDTPAWKPESPSARARTALMPPLAENERLVSGSDRLVVLIDNDFQDELAVSLSLSTIDFVSSQPNVATVQIDDEAPLEIPLNPSDEPQVSSLELAPGKHRISIGTQKHVINQYLRVRIDAKNHAKPPIGKRERYYHAATKDQPLEFTLSGPARIRIDELRGDSTTTRFETVPSGQRRSFSFSPPNATAESLFRIFELVSGARETTPLTTYTPIESTPIMPSSLVQFPTINLSIQSDHTLDDRALSLITHELSAPSIRIEDLYPLGGQEDATWSFTPGWYQRRPVEESESARVPDEFTEFLFSRRFHEREDFSCQTNIIYRERESAGSTFGVGHFVEREHLLGTCSATCRDNIFVRLQGTMFVQDTDDSPLGATHTAEWSGQARGQLGRRMRFSEKLSRTQAFSLFGRWLSMDANRYRLGDVDQDIFTPYKNDHRSGFVLSDTVWYRPKMDTRMWLRGFAISNEDFDPLGMDALGFRTGWDQAVGPLDLGFSYRLARFLNDQDRDESFTQHVLNFGVLANYWCGPKRRFEFGSSVQHNLNQGDTSLYFFASWFTDNGRGFRDFRSGERPFLQLRRLMSRRQPNNRYLFVDG